MTGAVLGPAAIEQLKRDHRKLQQLTAGLSSPQRKRIPGGLRHYAVILDDAMSGSDFLAVPAGSTDPGSPNATVCKWDTGLGKYVQTTQRLAVSNFSGVEHVADTPGVAIAVDGNYWFFGACDPLASRPTPPWSGA